MNSVNKIPIKNIYYMLCYSFNILLPKGYELCGIEEFNNIYNLMCKMLIHSINKLKHLNLKREYDSFEEPLNGVKGRINIGQSIQKMSFVKKQLFCNYDSMSQDILLNQVIKSTIGMLIKYEEIDKNLRLELIKINSHLKDISSILLTKRVFNKLLFKRSDENYKVIINICRFIFEELIVYENGQDVKFLKFVQDSHMAKLYEKFVLNFLKLNLPKDDYVVHSPKISWNVEDLDAQEYLPEMRTDIVVECKSSNTQLIIDTKFYGEIFTKSNFGTKVTYRSENMYQIYTYLNNSLFKGKKLAMLLYPTTDIELNKKHKIGGNYILIRTLNLGKDWNEIEERLLDIASIVS